MPRAELDVAVVGAGVVGCAATLALARRGVEVAQLEAEPEAGLAASGTNSGILHTGFDSEPGELETELILAAGAIRDPLLSALGVPILRCGALVRAQGEIQRDAVAAIAGRAHLNGITAHRRRDGTLEIPGEAVTDPVAYTLGLAAEAQRQGAQLRTRYRVAAIQRRAGGLALVAEDGASLRCRIAVNCAGLEADRIARMVGDESFTIYPRKGEFLVFDPPSGGPLEHILLPVPTPRTRGVLVFPTTDGKVVAGPTAVDLEDRRDWSVRPQARSEIMPRAAAMYPALRDSEPIAAYAGLRPAGRGVNYVIGPSHVCPALVNVAAIRSTGLSASLGIGERVVDIVRSLGVTVGPQQGLIGGAPPVFDLPWWRRTAEFRVAAAG